MRAGFASAVAMLAAAVASAHSSHRSVRAIHVAGPPRIDGSLDDAAWRGCAWQGGFVQREPNEGAPATLATEVCVTYDDARLYVAMRMADPEPGQMTTVLGRRDVLGESDKAILVIDSYHDHRTGFRFLVNPSGTIGDAAMRNDVEIDFSWDGVWEAATLVHDRGWNAEFAIPFATLRFDARPDLAFGVQFARYAARLGEFSSWTPRPRASNAEVSLFGHLHGIDRARPGLGAELSPYALVRTTASRATGSTLPDETARFQAGIDGKFGLTGTLTLDASVNPDFGQVEVDPAVVNLTAFETFFPEKRPFFLEGAEIFATPLRLLHTRRIGAAPPAPATVADGEEVVETEPVAPILAAGKLTGRAGDTAVGLLAAGVNDTRALVRRADGLLREDETSPDMFFGAARVRQPIGGRSTAGAMATWVGRDGERDAVAGGPDVEIRAGDWVHGAYLVAADAEGVRGWGAGASADYTGRVWGVVASVTALSPDLDLNDAGFLQQVNLVNGFALGRWRLAEPRGIHRDLWVRLLTSQSADFDARATERVIASEADQTFTNRMALSIKAGVLLSAFDNYETRGGPPYLRPAKAGVDGRFQTDESRDAVAVVGGGVARGDGAEAIAFVEMPLRAFGRLEVTPRVGYSRVRDRARWVETIADAGGERHVFGDLDYDQADASLRATLGIARALTLQAFAQYLHARGRHDGFRELTGADAFGAFDYAGDPDFQTTSLIVNAVLRWEYLPLSSAYLVWTHMAALDGADPVFEPVDVLGPLSDVVSDDVVIAKLSYLWQM